jgi:homoserine dehydrogenase
MPLTAKINLEMSLRVIRVGLLGFGVVGEGTYRMLQENKASIEKRTGSTVEIVKIGIRDPQRERSAPKELFTTDLYSIVNNPEIDVIIEVIGGLDPAYGLLKSALSSGKHVITANKELIAKHGPELMRLATSNKLDLHFEAAVGGGIPLLQPMRHQLAGNEVLKLMGIVNGTTNYILTKMTEERWSLEQALKVAQEKGYAEADPTSDVDGYDAQFKTAILASTAFAAEVHPDNVYREGIRAITTDDIRYANQLGYRIKLLGIVEAKPDGILARVHPTLLPRKHPLANVHDVYNAVWINGDFVGDVILSGRGAGSDPTASAVVGDLIDTCQNIRIGGAANVITPEVGANLLPMDVCQCRYYLRINVVDQPKVLGAIANCLGDYNVSLAAMEMCVLDEEKNIGEIVFLTHVCEEKNFQEALKEVKNSPQVLSIENAIRVEG